MENKLSHHFQSIPGWASDVIAQVKPKYVKVIDPPEQNPFPGVRVIGRTFMDEGLSNEMVRRGKEGAQDWFNHWRGFYESREYVHAWEGPNEPNPMWSFEMVDGLVNFTHHLAFLMWYHGFTLVGMNWSVGTPYLDFFADSPPRARYFKRAVQALYDHGHFFGIHEYSAPMMQDREGAYCLRYKHIVEELRDVGCDIPPILIGECGIDGGTLKPPQERRGWRTYLPKGQDESWYANQLLWYNSQIQDVEAAFVFTAGPNEDWMDFEVTEKLARQIGEIKMPERAKGFFVSSYQGDVDWDRVKAEGYSYVHIRVSSAKKADRDFARNWDEAGRVGLLRSAWHYLMPNVDAQAGFFHDTLDGRVPELGYYVDLEDSDLALEKAESFLEKADELLGQTVGVYTSPGWLNQRGTPAWEHRKLWAANWTTANEPLLPKAWKTWEFWQHTEGIYNVPGFPNAVCLDRFNGTVEELRAKYGGSPVVVVPVELPVELPNTEEKMDIFDINGAKKDWAWVQEKYGKVTITPAVLPAYCIITLQERDGASVIMPTVLDKNSRPVVGEVVCYSWENGKEQDCAKTKEHGEFGFGLGRGSYYFIDRGEVGPHGVWVSGKASEKINGLGFLPGTEHMRLDPTFQWKEKVGEAPTEPVGPVTPPVVPPTPTDDWQNDVVNYIQAAKSHLELAMDILDTAEAIASDNS